MHWAHACMHWARAPNEDFCMHVDCSIESTMHPCRGCAYVLWPARTRSCGSSSPPPCPWLDVHGSMSMARCPWLDVHGPHPTRHHVHGHPLGGHPWACGMGVWGGHVGWACVGGHGSGTAAGLKGQGFGTDHAIMRRTATWLVGPTMRRGPWVGGVWHAGGPYCACGVFSARYDAPYHMLCEWCPWGAVRPGWGRAWQHKESTHLDLPCARPEPCLCWSTDPGRMHMR